LVIMMRQPKWDRYEVALLIEAYQKIEEDRTKRRAIIAALSASLRERACFEIDDTYRNENGINMRLGELDFLFSGGSTGLKNTSDLFREMVDLYIHDRNGFEQILMEAKKMSSSPSNTRTMFCEWLQEKAPKLKPDTICLLLAVGEEFCRKIRVLKNPLFETTDVDTIKKFVKTVSNNKIFRIRNKKQYPAIVNAANWYYSFICAMPELGVSKSTEERLEVESNTISGSQQAEETKPESGTQPSENTPLVSDTHPEEETESDSISVTLPSGSFDAEFYNWLCDKEGMAVPTCRSYVSALHTAEIYAKEHGFETTILCTKDSDVSLTTASALMQDADFRGFNQEKHNRFSAAFQKLNKFFAYLHPEKFGMIQPTKRMPAEPVSVRRPSESISSTLAEAVDTLIKGASEGIKKVDICAQLSDYNTHQINLAIAACHAVLVLKKYYHPDNISDYQEMADILLEVITRQFSANGNYTSAQQLYNEARAKLDDFFFYNNAFDSRQEVYDLAVHLFVQEKYKGNSFIFLNNTHIWKEEPDYPKDYHGLLIKYAREHGNVFSREEAISYFDQIGSPSSAQTFSNVLFNTGSRSFLQWSENQFILTEALHVNDYFLATVKTQIENLLEGEDYIAMGEIDDYFYTTLPSLPSGVCWSALLLEDLLRVYDIGFAAIEAGNDNDKKTIPAAIVRKNSPFRTFSDVVWNEVSKAFSLPRGFTSQEFREFLLDKGFIRGSEKMYNVHKTVAGDIRFFWTDKNRKVTIN
jgi:hypothetical protein